MILGGLPGYLTYLPVDFERETLERRPVESGYDSGLKTMFIVSSGLLTLSGASL